MSEIKFRKYGCIECGNEIPEIEKYCECCKKIKTENKKFPCLECGTIYVKSNMYQKYCSDKCRKNTKCNKCGNTIKRKSQCKFCYVSPPIIIKCKYPQTSKCAMCNKDFYKRGPQHKYCSEECRSNILDTLYSNNKFLILNRDGFRCMYCGCTPADKKELVLDHVFPHISGGKSTAGNLVTSCISCNSSKGDNALSESGQKYITEYIIKANKENNIHPDRLIRGSHTRGKD